MNTEKLLFELSARDAVGYVTDAADFAADEMSRYCDTERFGTLGVMGFIKGKTDYTVMIDAHIDQVAMVVTSVNKNGFLTVSKAGGIDIRALPSRAVTVHGKKKLTAVFCSTPPHLASGEVKYENISDIHLDTGLGKAAQELVSVGDIVTFSAKPIKLSGDRVSGRSFDDRAGVVCVLELARRLSRKALPCNAAFVLSDAEELGLRGAGPAAYRCTPDEAVAVDVTFADAPDISEEESCKLGYGAMIGVSPALDRGMTNRLISTAEENGIAYGIEAMGGKTGTNADKIAESRGGVKTVTVSIPLRNMHTDAEVISLGDIEKVCDLLEKYILSGGVGNV